MGSEAFLFPVYKQVGSLSRGLKVPAFTSEMFQVGLSCYLGLNSGRSVSINVDKTRKRFPEKFMARPCFPNVRSFPYGKDYFQCQFLFSRCKLCLRYTAGNFNEKPSMRALEKFCEHEQASTDLIFASNSSKGQFLCEHFRIGCDHSTPLTLLT